MSILARSFRVSVLLGLLIAAFAAVVPASAAPGATILSYNVDEANCTVDVTVQVEDAGYYAVNMWDDGTFRAGSGFNANAGATFVIRFTFADVILQGAPGIGVYVEDGVGTAAATTYDSDSALNLWSDPAGTACAASGATWSATNYENVAACTYPLPSGSVVYNVPAGALAYYDDDTNAYAGFNLPPGTWYISEFGTEFAKVWIACKAQPIYIPVANVIR